MQEGRRECLLYERLGKVLVSGVFPRAASLHVAAALKLRIINCPKGPKLILYPHKALMQGKVGANGTLGMQRQQADADAVSDRTDTQTQGEGEGRAKSNRAMWVMKHHQQPLKA